MKTSEEKEKNKPRRAKQTVTKARAEELWKELNLDEETAESAVADVIEHEKKEGRHPWLKKLGWLVVLGVIGFALVNYAYVSTWVEYWFFEPQTYGTEPSLSLGQGEQKGEPNKLQIHSLGIEAPVLYASSKTEKEFQELLQSGVVHFPGTAKAGEVGNVYIFGHSSDYAWSKGEYKTIFALLPRIEIGRVIVLSDSKGSRYSYKVTEKFVAEKTDVQLLSQDTAGKKILTLQTSYPVGTALRRYIVRAVME